MNKFPTFNNKSEVENKSKSINFTNLPNKTTDNTKKPLNAPTLPSKPSTNTNIDSKSIQKNNIYNNNERTMLGSEMSTQSDIQSALSSDYNLDDESMISLSSEINENYEGYSNNNNKFSYNKSNNPLSENSRSNVSVFKKPMEVPKNIDFGVDLLANPYNTKEDLSDNLSIRSGVSSLYLNKKPDMNVQSNIQNELRKEHTVEDILNETEKTINNTIKNNFFDEKVDPSGNNNQTNVLPDETKKNIEIKQHTNKNITTNYNKYAELTPHEIFDKKEEILIELEKLEEKGIKSEKKYNIQSDLYEMERCYLRLKRRRDQDVAVKLMRKVLLTFVTGTEYMSEKFLSDTIHLDGWSESVLMNIVDYDEVFEELYDKYSSKFAVSPEIKLMIMLVGSAFTFHMTKMLTGGFVKQTSSTSTSIPQTFTSNEQSRQNTRRNTNRTNNTNNVNTNNTQPKQNPIFNLFNVMNETPKNQNVKNDELDDIINEIEQNNELEIPNEEDYNIDNDLNEILSENKEQNDEIQFSLNDSENSEEFYDEIISDYKEKPKESNTNKKTQYYDEILDSNEKTLVL